MLLPRWETLGYHVSLKSYCHLFSARHKVKSQPLTFFYGRQPDPVSAIRIGCAQYFSRKIEIFFSENNFSNIFYFANFSIDWTYR